MKINFEDYNIENMNFGKEIVEEAIRFFADMLMTENQQTGLEIDFYCYEGQPDFSGEVEVVDFDVDIPDFVEVHVTDNLDDEEFMKTIAHEMVHVAQLRRGTLRVDENYNLNWYRKEEVTDVGYNETPWELEALREEGRLFVEWKNKNS